MIVNESCESGLHVVTVSDVGIKHAVDNMPNQDCAMYQITGDSFFMAIADGVGSCEYAEQGSFTACHICKSIFEDIIAGKISFSCNELSAQIVSRWLSYLDGKDSAEYCTTLKAVYATKSKAIVLSIGDGLLLLATGTDTVIAPQYESDFLNETACLSRNIVPADLWSFEIDLNGQSFAFFLSTDGVANSIISGQEGAFIGELLNETGNDSLRDEIETFFTEIQTLNADDKTLGVVKYDFQNG